MASTRHPTSRTPASQALISFVVSLCYAGSQRGVAGPFSSEDDAENWVAALLDGEAGWSATVAPLTPPAALPLAAERRRAAAPRPHLYLVR
jgi:hypothetical protein